MEVNLENPISTKQILDYIESSLNDVSVVKEKSFNTNEEYVKIKVYIEQLQNKAKELKLRFNNLNIISDDSIDLQNQRLSIDNSIEKLELYKADFEHLKKENISYQVIYYL